MRIVIPPERGDRADRHLFLLFPACHVRFLGTALAACRQRAQTAAGHVLQFAGETVAAQGAAGHVLQFAGETVAAQGAAGHVLQFAGETVAAQGATGARVRAQRLHRLIVSKLMQDIPPRATRRRT